MSEQKFKVGDLVEVTSIGESDTVVGIEIGQTGTVSSIKYLPDFVLVDFDGIAGAWSMYPEQLELVRAKGSCESESRRTPMIKRHDVAILLLATLYFIIAAHGYGAVLAAIGVAVTSFSAGVLFIELLIQENHNG